MDPCFQDITVEFLAVAFHSILYYTSVYPQSVFETRKKYNVVVYSCIHPEIRQYIDLCLKSIRECLKNGQLSRVVFAITDADYAAVMKFVFDVHRTEDYDETSDAYLIQAEQNLRAFCLCLAKCDTYKTLPEDASFTIHIHTNEAMAVSMALDPVFEDFPLVEVNGKRKDMDNIIPLRSFPIRNYRLESYVEI
ncbi:mitotic spindle assembly checkpoint protein MAD2B [Ostrinia furnacalis]|uniref:mitotic spindle assembly checkpoint protein MAD2B n=1 Tax=Ostrinia furnacalis TaxID=93504 RepID=UPI00103E5021|nr:mitotic spindle assembly checkpoint protein MAD2B [Ostrinia furnacalis]